MTSSASNFVPIKRIGVSTYTIPTDFPESDGTLEWDSTTLVLVEAKAANETGVGYTYADAATANLIHRLLARAVESATPWTFLPSGERWCIALATLVARELCPWRSLPSILRC